ncbi:MAG: phosphate ABC transporter permease PstA [Vicinamibacteria bacterium]|nr:phosphate ABC transporter permease PstA [Vicinamibacteria bacterium]
MSPALSAKRNRPAGESLVWFTASALGLCLLMIGGLIAIILTNGLGFFWPRPLVEFTLKEGSKRLAEISAHEGIPNPGHPDHLLNKRTLLKVGNRDLRGIDFEWVNDADVVKREAPADAWFVERREYGPFLGFLVRISEGGREIASSPEAVATRLAAGLEAAERDRAVIRRIERNDIGAINLRLEQARLSLRSLDLKARANPGADQKAERDRIATAVAADQQQYATRQKELEEIVAKASSATLVLRSASGEEKELRLLDIYRAYPANQLSWLERASIYASRLGGFLWDDPREANTEGGIFPAIFGTVMMVFLMTLVVVPTGVLAALYLREYAAQSLLVRIVRIAVNNLAGVPSIVFGVFGLGFFVYTIGGTIDRTFFPDALPTPTYGTGGILWAALTLALLTVPVVIVASEEALAAVPRSIREASLALGATKFQTIVRVVLPSAAPGILTGLILAMARGAGEVAPLMLTGVVKLAPDLPLDGFFPFFHLDRKFMHLGFHIYDVGFQSPNVEAAKPMVYMTTVLLLLIVVLLNLTAIVVRNRLRRRFQAGAF